MLAILCASTLPGSDAQSESYSPALEIFKNFLHLPAYGGLGFLLFHSLSSSIRKIQIQAFMIAVAYGILNEFVQSCIPYRYYSYQDMCVNALGAGIVIFWLGRGRRP